MKKRFTWSLAFGIGLASILSGQKNVGVETDNPQATLDVNGNMIVRKIEGFTSESTGLTWNPKTKKVSAERTYEGINYKFVNYNVSAYNGKSKSLNENTYNNDYVDFDTKIPYEKYDIFVTSAGAESGWDTWDYDPQNNKYVSNAFNGRQTYRKGYHPFIGMDYVNSLGVQGNPTGQGGYKYYEIIPVPLINTVKDPITKTWHITADYAGARPKSRPNFHESYGSIQWGFEVFVAPANLVKRELVEAKVDYVDIKKPKGGLDRVPKGEAPINPLSGEKSNPNQQHNGDLGYVPGGTGKVNINNPSQTNAVLNIGGDLRVVNVSAPTVNSIPIRRRKSDGVLIAEKDNKKPFIAMSFEIEPRWEDGGDQGWPESQDLVVGFDTGVPKDKFYMAVTSATLLDKDTRRSDVGISRETTGGGDQVPFPVVFVRDRDDSKNWLIFADYKNAGPNNKNLRGRDDANFRTREVRIIWKIDVLLYPKEGFLDIEEYVAEDGTKPNAVPAWDDASTQDYDRFGFAGGRGLFYPNKANSGERPLVPLSADKDGKVTDARKLKGLE